MLRYGLAGAIQIPWYAASRFSGSSSIASVGTHSKGSRTWSSASFVKRWVGFFGLKSPTTPIRTLMFGDILARPPGERAQPRRRLHEPARQEQDDRDEQRAEDQQVEVHPADRQVLLEEDVEDRAQHRAVDRADAADERDEEGVEGPVRPEGVRRVVADVVIGEEPARKPGERRREHQGQELEPERADAAGLGRLFALADRLHGEAGPRALEGRHDADGRRRQREREIVAVGEAVGADRRRRQRRDLGQHVADGDTQDFAERERADGEVGASETEGDRADEQRERGRGQRAQPRPREHRPLGDPERARDEGAEAEERRVAEVDLAGVAGDDVPRLGERHREEHEEEEVQHVVAPDDERHRQGGQRRHAEREPPATAHRAKSPRGRATSTARKMTRPTTSRYGPPNANALAASARPRTRPPTKVPSIEPSPARTTTMSAFSVHSSPMDGLIE